MPEENEKPLTAEEILAELASDPRLSGNTDEETQVLSRSHHHGHSRHGHSHNHSHGHKRHRHRIRKNRRSSGSKKKARQRREAIKEFFKFYRKRILMILLVILLSASLIATAIIIDGKHWIGGGSSTTSSSIAEDIKIITPDFSEDIVLVKAGVAEFVDPYNLLSTDEILKKYSGTGRLDVGLPVTLSYRAEGLPPKCVVTSAVFEVADNLDFDDSRVFMRASRKSSVDVYHLKTDTTYLYRITLNLSNGETVSTQGSFKTAKSPRILTIDGIVNVRDFGGRTTLDGKTVRQGVLFRGSELDGAVEPTYKITDKGIADMLTVLNVQTDLDLRSSANNIGGFDPLGKNVEHIYFDASMYSDVFTENGKKSLRSIFAELADKSNYPVYLHCTYGFDRTGTVCYLLGALLGMSEEDLITDYSVSGLAIGNMSLDNINGLRDQLAAYEGETLKDDVECFLLSIGVTEQEIQNIRDIFLDD